MIFYSIVFGVSDVD